MCQSDQNPTKMSKTTQGHQLVFIIAKKSNTLRWARQDKQRLEIPYLGEAQICGGAKFILV